MRTHHQPGGTGEIAGDGPAKGSRALLSKCAFEAGRASKEALAARKVTTVFALVLVMLDACSLCWRRVAYIAGLRGLDLRINVIDGSRVSSSASPAASSCEPESAVG